MTNAQKWMITLVGFSAIVLVLSGPGIFYQGAAKVRSLVAKTGKDVE